MQSKVNVTKNSVTGDLKYYDDAESELVQAWGAGNFLAVKFSEIDKDATSVKVGLRPTYKNGSLVDDDSGLVEVIDDPDKNGVFKITDKSVQKFKVIQTNAAGQTHTQLWDLSKMKVAIAPQG